MQKQDKILPFHSLKKGQHQKVPVLAATPPATPVLQKQADAPPESAAASTKAHQLMSQAATTLDGLPKQVNRREEVRWTHNNKRGASGSLP